MPKAHSWKRRYKSGKSFVTYMGKRRLNRISSRRKRR